MTATRKMPAQLIEEQGKAGQRIQIVDVRTVGEFDSGHVPGALNIPMETLESRLEDLDLQVPTVLVCQSGTRANSACERLGHRFTDASVLVGGTNAWAAAGGKLVRSTRVGKSLMQQALLGAGILNAIGVLLAIFVHPAWIGLNAFVACGLVTAGATGFCLMAVILSKMPWNRKPSNGVAQLPCEQA